MPRQKQIQPHEKIGLKLTAAERTLILEGLSCLPTEHTEVIQGTPANQPVLFTLDDLDDFGGYVAAEANHSTDKKLQKKLDAIFQKIQKLLDTHTDEEPPQTIKIEDARKAQVLAENAARLAEFGAMALIAADELGIKTKPLENFWLSPAQREVLLAVPDLSKPIKAKLAKDKSSFTVAEVASMTMALAGISLEGDPRKQIAILLVAKQLTDRLQTEIAGIGEAKLSKAKEPKIKADPNTLFQFKITLKESEPPIWRRIQVEDCTLDKLHEHIQTAMGWTNSHLHQFEIDGKQYGDPELLDDGFGDCRCINSTRTRISKVMPKEGKRFSFTYEYDFGDGWEHEVVFEGRPTKDSGKKYPLCLEGNRACPPEDVGGLGGFYEFLEALVDPKHEQHEEMLEWGGNYDPEKFDTSLATKAMKKGLPDWRE